MIDARFGDDETTLRMSYRAHEVSLARNALNCMLSVERQ
jgi:hypothetical protein